MARRIANGAVIADSGEWYWDGTGWQTLVVQPQSKAPGRDEQKQLPFLIREQSTSQVRAAGQDLADLVTSLGNLAAAREELARRRDVNRPAEESSPERQNANHPAEQELVPVPELSISFASAPKPRKVEVKVKTYRSAKDYERDAPKMAADGWFPQGQTPQRGKINMGRTAGKAVLFFPWALMRPSRGGDPIIVTWIRD